jgi:hypothetical protein
MMFSSMAALETEERMSTFSVFICLYGVFHLNKKCDMCTGVCDARSAHCRASYANESEANVTATSVAPPAIATLDAPDFFLLGVGVGVDVGALVVVVGAVVGAAVVVAGAEEVAAGGTLVTLEFEGVGVTVVVFVAVPLVASSMALVVGVKVTATTAARARTSERNCMVE